MSKSKHTYIGIALLIIIGAGIYYAYSLRTIQLTETNSKSFESSALGISFLYPTYYTLDQTSVGSGALAHWRIALKKSTVEGVSNSVGQAGEGSPGISIDIYQNDHQYDSAEDFLNENPNSDIQLATSPVDSIKVADGPASSYHSTGLYESRTVVIARGEYVYMLRVAGAQEQSGLEADFERILAAIKIVGQ